MLILVNILLLEYTCLFPCNPLAEAITEADKNSRVGLAGRVVAD